MIALFIRVATLAGVALVASAAPPARADDVAGADVYLKRYDAIMSPPAFEADTRMIAHREDGTTRSYKMRVLKSGYDKLRAAFIEPASAKGQEMLRNGENLWLYMPNLKRAVRVAARDQFMGGDFNNADVLRVHYEADYTATIGKSDDPKLVVLELKAKGPHVAYDVIKLWMTSDAKTAQPVRTELYAASGKLLRSAAFSDVKELGKGWLRPTKLVMKNELVPGRSSEMIWDAGSLKTEIPSARFSIDDLGR